MKVIKIKFQNGISSHLAYDQILNKLNGEFKFIETDEPDFILFGPYANDLPPKGNYVRIGYFCENMQPDMSICEWAFGMPPEEEINHPRYKKIQLHNADPQKLIKPADYNPEGILASKQHFCNFVYSNPINYRSSFFRQLSKYKKIDAPGKSMNNIDSIDEKYKGDIFERKKQFLSKYKFTIAFENYVYPGYQTEKLYDAMQANSVPIYCGDPYIDEAFNTKSFVNTGDYLPNESAFIKWLEKNSQGNFKDIRPRYLKSPLHRFKRKLKALGRDLKMDLQFGNKAFQPVIDRIIELDQDDDKYLELLRQPWFINNTAAIYKSNRDRWIEIFNGLDK